MPRDDATDERTIHRALRRRDYRRALEQLARVHGAQIGRLCFAMTGNQAEAEELTQEVLIAAYRALPAFEGRSSLRTWIYTIARRTCARALQRTRRRARLLALEPVGPEPESWAGNPQRALESVDEQERLRRAVEQLPPGQREVLLLRYVGGLRFRDVARVCQISEEAARQRASGGLRRLRRVLAARAESEDGPIGAQVALACQELSR